MFMKWEMRGGESILWTLRGIHWIGIGICVFGASFARFEFGSDTIWYVRSGQQGDM